MEAISSKRTDVSPRLTDIIPLYGGLDYVGRTTFGIFEEVPIRDHIKKGMITLAQVVYNSFFLAELLQRLEGKPSITYTLLEKILSQ